MLLYNEAKKSKECCAGSWDDSDSSGQGGGKDGGKRGGDGKGKGRGKGREKGKAKNAGAAAASRARAANRADPQVHKLERMGKYERKEGKAVARNCSKQCRECLKGADSRGPFKNHAMLKLSQGRAKGAGKAKVGQTVFGCFKCNANLHPECYEFYHPEHKAPGRSAIEDILQPDSSESDRD